MPNLRTVYRQRGGWWANSSTAPERANARKAYNISGHISQLAMSQVSASILACLSMVEEIYATIGGAVTVRALYGSKILQLEGTATYSYPRLDAECYKSWHCTHQRSCLGDHWCLIAPWRPPVGSNAMDFSTNRSLSTSGKEWSAIMLGWSCRTITNRWKKGDQTAEMAQLSGATT